jgi:hypothetical protein
MFELLVPAEKARLDKLKVDEKAYDLQLRPRLMAQTIEELQDAQVERVTPPGGWQNPTVGHDKPALATQAA